MTRIAVRKAGYAMGAEVTGVDLTAPLDPGTIAEIRQASLDHIVLCFPRQELDENSMAAFCRHFGALEARAFADNQAVNPAVQELTNKPRVLYGKAGAYARADLWHSDQDYTDRPSSLTFLWAKTLPDVGGDTMFANMYLAYETLSPRMRELIQPLEALHDHTLSLAFTKEPARGTGRGDQAALPAGRPPGSAQTSGDRPAGALSRLADTQHRGLDFLKNRSRSSTT